MKGFPIAENFYPTSPRARAKVDEYLEWQANNLRFGGALFFKNEYIVPKLKLEPYEPAIVEHVMENSLDAIENIWLADTTFLASNTISIADILACCDLEQIRITSYDPFKNRPKLENLWRRVRELTNPVYDEAHAVCYKMANRQSKL